MINQIISFLIGAFLVGIVAVFLDYLKHKKENALKKTLKEYIIDFEQTHKKGIKIFGIVCAIILGLIILINLGLFAKDFVANAVGGGFSIVNAKRIATIVGVIIFIVTLIINIIKGGFSISKFFGGFNIFAGAVQGKLIFYAIIIAVAFGVYQKIIQPTVRTDYKNQITAENVQIDQRPILPEVKYLFRVEILGLDIHFWRRTSNPSTKTTNNINANTVVQNGAVEVIKKGK